MFTYVFVHYCSLGTYTEDLDIQLKQMKSIGICESALAWIASYLSDRTFAVKIEDAISRRQQLNCGVPQGSEKPRWCLSEQVGLSGK